MNSIILSLYNGIKTVLKLPTMTAMFNLCIIRSVQFVLMVGTNIGLLFGMANPYTYLQTSTLTFYTLLSLIPYRECKYVTQICILLLNLSISVALIASLGFSKDVILVMVITWSVIFIMLLLDILYGYYTIISTRESLVRLRPLPPPPLQLTCVLIQTQGTNDSSLICPICLESLSEKRYLTKCGHSYCHYCLDSWIEKNKSCPTCRQDLCK